MPVESADWPAPRRQGARISLPRRASRNSEWLGQRLASNRPCSAPEVRVCDKFVGLVVRVSPLALRSNRQRRRLGAPMNRSHARRHRPGQHPICVNLTYATPASNSNLRRRCYATQPRVGRAAATLGCDTVLLLPRRGCALRGARIMLTVGHGSVSIKLPRSPHLFNQGSASLSC
jgi:hypothetical protein